MYTFLQTCNCSVDAINPELVVVAYSTIGGCHGIKKQKG